MKVRICLIMALMTAAVFGLWAQAEVSLQYQCGEANPVSTQIRPNLILENTGTTPVDLQSIVIYYFYTPDVSQGQEVVVEYAGIGTGNVIAVSGYGPGGNPCLRIGFTTGAGSLSPGGSTGEIRISVNNAEWGNYDQSNDYSFEPANTTYGPHEKIAVFENDELISGVPVCIPCNGLIHFTVSDTQGDPIPGATLHHYGGDIFATVDDQGKYDMPTRGWAPESTGPCIMGDAMIHAEAPGYVPSEDRFFSVSNCYEMSVGFVLALEPNTTPQTAILGDVNNDGKIDIVDALIMAQCYVQLIIDCPQPENGDVNCYGVMDIIDALLIAQYYVGLVSQFC